jgi:hypothetical protein
VDIYLVKILINIVMAKIIDPKTGEILSFTNDDPSAQGNNSSGADFSTLSKGKTLQNEINAGRNLDQAEMSMVGDRAQANLADSSNSKATLTSTGPQGTFTKQPGGKWTDEEGNPYSTDPNGYSGNITSSEDAGSSTNPGFRSGAQDQVSDNPSTGTRTIQDDYGNTITYDPNNPNPEASNAYSTSGQTQTGIVEDTNSSNAASSDTGNFGSTATGGRDSNTMDATNTYGGNVDVPVDDQGASSDVGNFGSGVNSNVNPGMNEDTLGTTPNDIGTGQVINNAVDGSGDLSFSSSALVGDSNISDTGKITNAATDAAGGAASKELSDTLSSVPSGSLSSVMGSIPGLGQAIGQLAGAGAVAALAGKLAGGKSPTAIMGLVKTIGLANVAKLAQAGVGQVSNFLKVGDKIGDAGGLAKNLATFNAANSRMPATVSVNGKNVTVPPPPRPMDIVKRAAGQTLDKNSAIDVPPEARAAADAVRKGMKTMGTTGGDESEDSVTSPGMPVNDVVSQFGKARSGRPVIPGMEAIMFDIPANALSKFTSLLPPMFKSILPGGAIAGLTNSGPVSLGGLTQLVGGAALGAVASQALRSVGGINSVSGMSGMLGAQAINRTMRANGPIPVNIASTYGNAIVGQAVGNVAGNIGSNIFGTSPNTSAVIANVVGTVTRVGLNGNSKGIPVSSQVLGLATNVALRSVGTQVGIPLGVLGNSSNMASNPIGSIIGSLVGGRVPVVPANLSMGNYGALSGLTQGLSGPGLAENIIPRSQMAGLLPGNLQNQIQSAVPPRMRTPGATNETEDRNRVSPTSPPESEQKPTSGDAPPTSPALVTGLGSNGEPPYGSKISKYFTLGDLSINATAGSHRIVKHSQSPHTVEQHIAGLSWIAVNILDALVEGGKMRKGPVNSGFRGPGGSTPGGAHGRGAAVDVKSIGGTRTANRDLMMFVRQQQLPAGLCILESNRSQGWEWCHLAGGKGHPTSGQWAMAENHSTYTGGEPYAKGKGPYDFSAWTA